MNLYFAAVRFNNDFFLVPNLISFARLLLTIPVCFLIVTDYEGQNTLIILLLLCMYFSDLLDGYIARKRNIVSEFGKIIDPLADKTAVVCISLCLLIIGKLPLWFFIVIALRDILILGFGTYLNSKKDIRLMSNYPGKLAVFSIGIVIMASLIDSDLARISLPYLYAVSLALITISSALYFKRYMEAVKQNA